MKKRVPSYIKESADLIRQLHHLQDSDSFRLKNAYIFTSDATSMYTNIGIKEGTETIRKYLETFEPNEPIELIMDLLTLVMNHNIFQFGSV